MATARLATALRFFFAAFLAADFNFRFRMAEIKEAFEKWGAEGLAPQPRRKPRMPNQRQLFDQLAISTTNSVPRHIVSIVRVQHYVQREGLMRYKMPTVGLLTGVLVALVAIHSYYVREMLAVLLFFSIGFSVVSVMMLILFLMDRGLYCALAWAGPFTADAELRLHRGWAQAEQFGRKHFHHSEKSVER